MVGSQKMDAKVRFGETQLWLAIQDFGHRCYKGRDSMLRYR